MNHMYMIQRFKTPDSVELVGAVGGHIDGSRSIILMHGAGQTRHSWAHAMHNLVGRGYHVISLDARGHGDSDWSPVGDYELVTLADDLKSVINTLPTRPVLVGASMGGMTALHAVGNSITEIAAGLVLVDVVPRLNADGVLRVLEFMRANPNGFATVEEAESVVAEYNPRRQRRGSNSGLMRNLRMGKDERLRWHWDPMLLENVHQTKIDEVTKSLADACARVRIPTLLLRGEQSDVVDQQGVSEFQEYLPHLEIINVAGTGHMIAGDDNDAFLEAVIAFIENIAPIEPTNVVSSPAATKY